MPNRLSKETSPYLLQHKDNPVNWFAWGLDAFGEAKARDVPVLLSVGYSSCHWCHVMEYESFENEEIAKAMNDNFVSVKVDREERPDIDSIYMSAVQSMTGQGGWPLTVFLTSEGLPFFGGTYYPPKPRGGMPGFGQILLAISDAYKNRRPEIEESGSYLREHIKTSITGTPATNNFEPRLLEQAYEQLLTQYDWEWGGFGNSIKFPQSMALEFLLRYHLNHPDSRALEMVETSLQKMASGGLYDHLGGGFHRYSTDKKWLVPHFEKMLYDNALLSRLYVHAFQVTGNNFYLTVAKDIYEYVDRDMTDENGLFYSAEDADSEGQEGTYYLWDPNEFRHHLTDLEMTLFRSTFSLREEGDFEGKTILHYDSKGMDFGFLGSRDPSLLDIRKKLVDIRNSRQKPFKDNKSLLSWNALMSLSFIEGYLVSKEDKLLEKAKLNINSLSELIEFNSGLFHSSKGGQIGSYGYLEDYSSLILAMLAMHEATLDLEWLAKAEKIADTLVSSFWDSHETRLYDTPEDGDDLIIRPSESYDNATPSGSSMTAEALFKLSLINNKSKYLNIFISLMKSTATIASEHPVSFGNWLCVYDSYIYPTIEIAIIADAPKHALKMRDCLYESYIPNHIFCGNAYFSYTEKARNKWDTYPLLNDREPKTDIAMAYLCENYVCELPVSSTTELLQLIRQKTKVS